MSPSVLELSEQAKRLPDLEKAELVNVILSQLDIPDPRVHQTWAEEVDRRVAAAEQGRLGSVPFDEEIKKYL